LGRVAFGCLGAVVLFVAMTSNSSSAELKLNNGPDGSYSLAVMSWVEIPFRSVTRQQYDFSCGSAAVATLLTYHYGRPTPESEVFAGMWAKGDQVLIRKVGFSMLDIKNFLDGIGYRTEGFKLTVAQLRQSARPGLVVIDIKGYKHFVVVKGVVGDRVLVGDPMLGLNQIPIDDFAKQWNGIFLAIVASPLKQRPQFNLASDWRVWAKAPLQDIDLDTPISQITDNLPPIYQVSPRFEVGSPGSSGP
jgi:predicted double-glycine peptidase